MQNNTHITRIQTKILTSYKVEWLSQKRKGKENKK